MPQRYPNYVSKSDHRDGTARKSQWTISERAEERVFRSALDARWRQADHAWGLYLANGTPQYLGVAAKDPGPTDPLVVAFYEVQNPSHGYPSRCKPGDRDAIPNDVLSAWLARIVTVER